MSLFLTYSPLLTIIKIILQDYLENSFSYLSSPNFPIYSTQYYLIYRNSKPNFFKISSNLSRLNKDSGDVTLLLEYEKFAEFSLLIRTLFSERGRLVLIDCSWFFAHYLGIYHDKIARSSDLSKSINTAQYFSCPLIKAISSILNLFTADGFHSINSDSAYLFNQLQARGFDKLAIASGRDSYSLYSDDSDRKQTIEAILERFAPYTKLFCEKECLKKHHLINQLGFSHGIKYSIKLCN